MGDSRNSERADGWGIFALFIEPFLEYGRSMHVWGDPNQLGARIKAGEIDAGALTRFLIASAILTLSIAKIVPDGPESLPSAFDLPFVGEAIFVLFLLLAGALTGFLAFWPLRWMGGRGSLRHTLIGAAYGVGAYAPIFTLVSGLLWQVVHYELPNGAIAGAETWYYAQLYTVIHQVSRGRAILAIMLPYLGIMVGAVLIVLFIY